MTRGDATYLYGSPAPRRWDDWRDIFAPQPLGPIRLGVRRKKPKPTGPTTKRALVKAARKQRQKGKRHD